MCGMDKFEFPQGGEAAASFPPALQFPFSVAVRLDKLSEVAKVNTDAMRLAQEEISEYRRQLQAKTTELEALKGTQESLERQRQDSEERHHADVLSYQVPWCSGQRPRLGRGHPAAGEEQRWHFGFRDVKGLWQMLGAESELAFPSPQGSGSQSLRWCPGCCVPQQPWSCPMALLATELAVRMVTNTMEMCPGFGAHPDPQIWEVRTALVALE